MGGRSIGISFCEAGAPRPPTEQKMCKYRGPSTSIAQAIAKPQPSYPALGTCSASQYRETGIQYRTNKTSLRKNENERITRKKDTKKRTDDCHDCHDTTW